MLASVMVTSGMLPTLRTTLPDAIVQASMRGENATWEPAKALCHGTALWLLVLADIRHEISLEIGRRIDSHRADAEDGLRTQTQQGIDDAAFAISLQKLLMSTLKTLDELVDDLMRAYDKPYADEAKKKLAGIGISSIPVAGGIWDAAKEIRERVDARNRINDKDLKSEADFQQNVVYLALLFEMILGQLKTPGAKLDLGQTTMEAAKDRAIDRFKQRLDAVTVPKKP